MKILIWFFRLLFPEKKTKKRNRRPTVKSLWPDISEKYDLWVECVNSRKIDYKNSHIKKGTNPKILIDTIFDQIPIWGGYVNYEKDEIEVKYINEYEPRIDNRVHKPGHCCSVWIADDMEGGDQENILESGITILSAGLAKGLNPGTYSFNNGFVYDAEISNWTRQDGHWLAQGQFIVDLDGYVHDTWHYATTTTKIAAKRRKRGRDSVSYIKSNGWRPCLNDKKAKSTFAAMFNFYQRRDGFWNAVVREEGVPPLAFPVIEQDIARVFPARIRDNKQGTHIVHWTRTHKRKTKSGYTNVKTHIKGNVESEIDGKFVKIIMPGKHIEMPSSIKSVVGDCGQEETIVDPKTGIKYGVIEENLFRKLCRSAVIKTEKIELKGAA